MLTVTNTLKKTWLYRLRLSLFLGIFVGLICTMFFSFFPLFFIILSYIFDGEILIEITLLEIVWDFIVCMLIFALFWFLISFLLLSLTSGIQIFTKDFRSFHSSFYKNTEVIRYDEIKELYISNKFLKKILGSSEMYVKLKNDISTTKPTMLKKNRVKLKGFAIFLDENEETKILELLSKSNSNISIKPYKCKYYLFPPK